MASKIYDGQIYEKIGEVPHTRADGTKTVLDQWRSRCAQCGVEFTCMTSTASGKFQPNRRCEKHKRAGTKPRKVA